MPTPGARRRARARDEPRRRRLRRRGLGGARRGRPLDPLRAHLLRRARHGARAAAVQDAGELVLEGARPRLRRRRLPGARSTARRSASGAPTASTPSRRPSGSSSPASPSRSTATASGSRDAFEGLRVGKLSGAVGTYAAAEPERRARRAASGSASSRRRVSTQVVPRDRHAELLSALALARARRSSASRPRSATCSAPRCARSRSRSAAGQKGSSAMPHKRNPITAERICGLARVVRGNALVGLENVALWHERDISHSSAERVILPDSILALDYMLDRFALARRGARRPRGADAREPRRRPTALSSASGCCSRSSSRGSTRDDAYRLVQRNALRAWDEGTDFRELVDADAEIAAPRRPRRRLRPRRVHAPTSTSCFERLRALVSTRREGARA